MAYNSKLGDASFHRDGHAFGKFQKRTSIGDGKRKRGSRRNSKKYRGQGRG